MRTNKLLVLAMALLLALGLTLLAGESARGAPISRIANTKHNLSSSGPGTTKATAETQICVFCHTPHGATPGVTPLWNRQLSGATYTPYTSSSLDANAIQGTLDQPGGSSKLCLSCHDGTLAIGNVNVLNGQGSDTTQGTRTIDMAGGVTTMPAGSGETTGFTRRLGTDLTNDHPISLNYTQALARRDGELREVDATQKWPPADGTTIGVRGSGYKPKLPLEPTGNGGTGQIQCASCHDPHLWEPNEATLGNQKFLRLNRFQQAPASPGYDADNDIICLSCHDKNGAAGSWAYSAHANNQVATPTYKSAAATQREFPANLPVWKAACLNCHDTHTVQGARRLLREGTDSTASPKAGGNPALEETCYQCHTDSASSIITPTTTVPDIKTDFTASTRRMPIASVDQPAGAEQHDIGGTFTDSIFIDCSTATNKCGADFVERRSRLGVAELNNRHAECTDCHNPHRVVKFRSFIGNNGVLSGTPDAAGTHRHDEAAGYTHTNIASGVLRGSWGVEPQFTSNSFHSLPSNYAVKRGDPGASPDTSVSATWVTREYQVCLKCHSDYGFSDNNVYPNGNRPALGSFTGGTPAGTNALTRYTNIAKEFNSPASHADEPLNLGSDAGSADSNFNTNNHRSWHPALAATGRTLTKRGITGTNPFRLPWSNAVGTQTMYCSDCHGSSTGDATVVPNGGENGSSWGPHGSSNNFILKGVWNKDAGATGRDAGVTANLLCFKCHEPAVYSTRNDSGRRSGFYGGGKGNLHNYHVDKIGRLHCTWCHVAVPHGWKNKALLVNLNDVGEEAGQGVGSSKEVSMNANADYYTQEPYYLEAKNKIRSFAASGNWSDTNCGSRGKSGTGLTTGRINSTNGQTNNNSGSGVDWMKSVCSNPP